MTDTKPSTCKPANLDEMLARTCFCKLKEFCPDKNSADCMRHHNIYAAFMQQKRQQKS
jgi:hypothetical protein